MSDKRARLHVPKINVTFLQSLSISLHSYRWPRAEMENSARGRKKISRCPIFYSSPRPGVGMTILPGSYKHIYLMDEKFLLGYLCRCDNLRVPLVVYLIDTHLGFDGAFCRNTDLKNGNSQPT